MPLYLSLDFLRPSDNEDWIVPNVLISLIPDPPSRSYAGELQELVKDWEAGETLVINGNYIALKYWRKIYKKYKPEIWKLIKMNWSLWRVSKHSFLTIYL